MTTLRAKIDNRRLMLAILLALVLHGSIFFAGWLFERLTVKELGAWEGPVLVRIGTPESLESPRQNLDSVVKDPPSPELPPQEPQELREPEATSLPEGTASSPVPTEESPQALAPPTEPTASSGEGIAAPVDVPVSAAPPPSTASASSAEPPAPSSSQVKGREHGNSYEMNFEGSSEEIGRAGAYDFISNYFPLPESLPDRLVAGAKSYMGMSSETVRSEIERYWEPNFDEWLKTSSIPMEDRPYYWSLLSQALNYDRTQAESRQLEPRPISLEFTVLPSQGTRGAELQDIRIINHGSDPRIEDAVVYGLSRWVYYNDTGRRVKGRITYRFID